MPLALHEPLLKTQQVAEALGVSASTVKRWVDSGVLKASRTVGRHRLVSLSEAIRFAMEQNLPQDRLAVLLGVGSGSISGIDDPVRTAVETALRRGRAAEARSLIGQAYAAVKDAARLADDLIRPVMERIGHEWSDGTLDVYQEHRASRIVEVALMGLIARVSPSMAGAVAPLAIGATPEGDHYTLAGLLCELSLREQGWDVINLGPNLPLPSLAKAVRVHRPRLVWFSINHLTDPERFVREYEAFYPSASTMGVAVCLGGPGLDGALRARLVAASFGERIVHLAEFARRILPASGPRSDPWNTTEGH
ncbi:MAG: carH [Planctomycetota bacterium]|nr:carH [Planctomycetota bacterium]